jgi:hypothetical protein
VIAFRKRIGQQCAAIREAPSRSYDPPVQQYELSRLPTGERVISEEVPSVRSVSLGFWIGRGSRDETDARAGVSHFIEHLLFKGTALTPRRRSPRSSTGSAGELTRPRRARRRSSTPAFRTTGSSRRWT